MDAQAETEHKHYSQSGELLKSRAEREPARSEYNLSEGRCAADRHGEAADQIQEWAYALYQGDYYILWFNRWILPVHPQQLVVT